MKVNESLSPNGHAARSDATRAKLIAAAIEAFGAHGYGATRLRDLARRSGAGLAAVSYHFGGKKELYLAAAGVIAGGIRDRFDPVAEALVHGPERDPVRRLEQALTAMFRIVVSAQIPPSWIQFMSRCERENDEAFGIIQDQGVSRLVQAVASVLATVENGAGGGVDLRMRVAAMIMMIFSLRSQRNLTLSVLGWDEIGAAEIARMEAFIRQIGVRDAIGGPQHP